MEITDFNWEKVEVLRFVFFLFLKELAREIV